ncbi:MAG: potassium-transporting ATPase subunit KdpA [Polyangiaceae bacterium]
MTARAGVQIALYLAVVLALSKPLGDYMGRVFEGEARLAAKVLGPVERLFYRAAGVRADGEMGFREYALSMLAMNLLGILSVYGLLRLQHGLPLNPAGRAGLAPDLAFNTAVSFGTNTNWQAYSGEQQLGNLAQMGGLAVQGFLSAGAGLACMAALLRGIARQKSATIGSYWVDLTRAVLYVLLPLSALLAIVLVSQGVVQSFAASGRATGLEAGEVVIPLGPAASQIAIKQIGTNGGGFFGANSAHPFENPTALSGFFEALAILLIPAAACHTYGRMAKDARQGWALLAAMTVLFVGLLWVCVAGEQAGNPALSGLGVDQAASALSPGGNMEGKEVRFGIAGSALWSAATTASSNGSVNSMLDSYTPVGVIGPLVAIQLGEVVFGGVGSGLYGMWMFVIVAVFVAGLMVGRTPEVLGKKIEAFELKMAALALIVPPALVLLGTAVALSTEAGRQGISNPGAHGLTQVLYAFSSAGNNNGSALAGLGASSAFYNTALGAAMLCGRYWVAIPVLAVASSLARKGTVPAGAGTLPTHTPLFVGLLVGTVLLVGALTFAPALALGPLAEHLSLAGGGHE